MKNWVEDFRRRRRNAGVARHREERDRYTFTDFPGSLPCDCPCICPNRGIQPGPSPRCLPCTIAGWLQ